MSNPKRRLRKGGPGEYWVLAVAVVLLVMGIWLAGAGGVQTQVSQGLGLRDGAIATYNQHAATAEVWVDIDGVWAGDRTHIILSQSPASLTEYLFHSVDISTE